MGFHPLPTQTTERLLDVAAFCYKSENLGNAYHFDIDGRITKMYTNYNKESISLCRHVDLVCNASIYSRRYAHGFTWSIVYNKHEVVYTIGRAPHNNTDNGKNLTCLFGDNNLKATDTHHNIRGSAWYDAYFHRFLYGEWSAYKVRLWSPIESV